MKKISLSLMMFLMVLLVSGTFSVKTTSAVESQECTPGSQIIISSVGDTVNDGSGSAVAMSFEHAAWYPSADLGSGAVWIWHEANISDPTSDHTDIFTKTININGSFVSANIEIAADNGYLIKVNDVTVVDKLSEEHNYEALSSHDLIFNSGNNTLEITVKNFGLEGSTPELNPAGLLYKLVVNDCSSPDTATISATKIVCDDESDLPNWGAGGPNVTSTTASDFLLANPSCHAADWTFELAPGDTENPGDNIIGAAGGVWTPFTSTTTIPLPSASIWVREQMKDGYIPFTGLNTTQNVSAELYCNDDVLHYDNYDFVSSMETGQIYYCVAFNVSTTPPPPAPACSDSQDNDQDELVDTADPGCHTDGDADNTESYDASDDDETDPPAQVCDTSLELIQNGSFESPEVTPATYEIIPDSNPLLKWVVAWVNHHESGLGLEIQNHVAGDPADGDQHAELDGYHPVNISQDIPTVVGTTYALNFKYSARPGRNAADNTIEVKADGNILGAILASDGTSNSNTVWETKTRNFTATGDMTKIEFNDTGTDTSYGGYIDSVSVRCVSSQPTPACSDSLDNDQDQLMDAADPGCHSDGDASNPDSYVPSDDDETNTVPPQCSDSQDNDQDQLIDTNDPGCHTDGDVDNTESYDANDDDETDPPADVCPNIDGNQSEVPDGFNLNNGNCEEDTNGGGGGGGSSSGSHVQCSDKKDNDGDGLEDSADPGCHTDGDANNDDSYVPSDRDEQDGQVLGASTGQVLGAETTCGIYLDKYLKMGRQNNPESVKKLQKFLNDYLHAGLKEDGIFGPLTDKYVRIFQASHKEKVLTPWGLNGPTGIVYLTTTTEINNIMCPTLNLPVPTNLIPITANPAFPPLL